MTEPLPEQTIDITVSFPLDVAELLVAYIRRVYNVTEAQMTDVAVLKFAVKRLSFLFARDNLRKELEEKLRNELDTHASLKNQEMATRMTELETMLTRIKV